MSGTLLEMETGEGPKGILLVANKFGGCMRTSLATATAMKKIEVTARLLLL